jgi:hypothetical protein
MCTNTGYTIAPFAAVSQVIQGPNIQGGEANTPSQTKNIVGTGRWGQSGPKIRWKGNVRRDVCETTNYAYSKESMGR